MGQGKVYVLSAMEAHVPEMNQYQIISYICRTPIFLVPGVQLKIPLIQLFIRGHYNAIWLTVPIYSYVLCIVDEVLQGMHFLRNLFTVM